MKIKGLIAYLNVFFYYLWRQGIVQGSMCYEDSNQNVNMISSSLKTTVYCLDHNEDAIVAGGFSLQGSVSTIYDSFLQLKSLSGHQLWAIQYTTPNCYNFRCIINNCLIDSSSTNIVTSQSYATILNLFSFDSGQPKHSIAIEFIGGSLAQNIYP